MRRFTGVPLAISRRKLFLAAQWVLAAAVVWLAVMALRGQWDAAGERLATVRPQWGPIALATVIVLATYVLLIDTWRRIVIAAGETLSFADAARIWFISNLGKYLPGKVWSIAAMSVMARERDVSPLTAAGSSILIQVITVAAGIGVVLVAGAQALDRPIAAASLGIGILIMLGAVPFALPAAGRMLGSITGKPVAVPVISASTVWWATARSVLSWITYGVAFQFFVQGILGSATGATLSYIAVYAASYIIGFLALFAPGGAVVRESAMISGMLRLGLAGQADALVVAVASRLWLTVTELLPGLAYLAAGGRNPRNR
jgi:hypothetical protein